MFGDRRQVILTGTILILVVIIAALSTITTSYEPYTVTGLDNASEQVCEHHHASCTCLGSLSVAESYPEQFQCSGPEICRDINRTVCQ